MEGARTVGDLLAESFDEILGQAAYTAIACHHSAEVSNIRPFNLSPRAQKEAGRVWALVTGEKWRDDWRSLVAERSVGIDNGPLGIEELTRANLQSFDFLVYLLLVRMLRISDSHSLQQEDES